MNAGRGLDALVAEKVMGWRVVWRECLDSWAHDDATGDWTKPETVRVPCEDKLPGVIGYADFGCRWSYRLWEIPRYSTDIAAAWKVVEKLQEHMTFGLDWLGFDGEEWRCIFAWTKGEHDTDKPYASVAPTAPLAICLAALKAVEDA